MDTGPLLDPDYPATEEDCLCTATTQCYAECGRDAWNALLYSVSVCSSFAVIPKSLKVEGIEGLLEGAREREVSLLPCLDPPV